MLELLFFLLIQCPLVGLAVMAGGHMVGNMMEGRDGHVGTAHKYGLLVGLGFVTMTVHALVSGGLG